ncbi:MAG TPA: class I SAM-dependent methyltransferase [Desulfurivibrionaceae bacterium]|nr:class I SAM-dependent methyltransferase [Desulfurivibrionaceae bacterium]
MAKFYAPEELLAMMREAGFREAHRRPLTFGIVSIYLGVK